MARLTRIYTRTGDDGETSLVGGHRVPKDSLRIETYGTLDELSAAIGLARAWNLTEGERDLPSPLDSILERLQHKLFDMGAQLATLPSELSEGMPGIGEKDVGRLESWIDEINQPLGPLCEFILPGGTPLAASLHLARTICRRAERSCVALARREEVPALVVPYLNRLSDLLFVLSRWINHEKGVEERFWKKTRRRGEGLKP